MDGDRGRCTWRLPKAVCWPAVSCLVVACEGNSSPPVPAAPSAGSPTVAAEVPTGALQAESWHYDFGALFVDESRRTTFRLHNASDAPVPVAEVRSTCGCVVLDPIAAFTLAPGERWDLEVEFLARKVLGKVEKVLKVYTTEAGANRTYAIRCLADVSVLYQLDPVVLEFGDIVRGDRIAAELSVRTTDGFALDELRALPTDHAAVEVVAAEVSPAPERKVRVTVDTAELSFGKRVDLVELDSGHPRQSRVRVPLRMRIEPPLELDGDGRVNFGDVSVSEGASAAVVLRRLRPDCTAEPDDPVLETTLGEALQARWTPWQGDQRALELTVRPGAPLGGHHGSVSFGLGVEGMPRVVLSVYGRVFDASPQ